MAKKAPNPYGKKGSPKHQSAIAKLVKMYDDLGFEVIRELMVIVLDGIKPRRFVDLALRLNGEIVQLIQVGKTNKDGITPVKRERDAMDDIKKTFPNTPLDFKDYEKNED